MTWIEPFEMQTLLVNVFAGRPDIFFGISLIAIVGMAAYFRMTQITMFFMIGVFVVMFNSLGVIEPSIYTFIVLIAALSIGFVVNKMVNRQ